MNVRYVLIERLHEVQHFERRILRSPVVRDTDAAGIHEAFGASLEAAQLGQRWTTAGVNQRVLFVRVSCEPILAGAGRIDELEFDSGPDVRNISIKPAFERKSRRRAAAFPWFAFVGAAGWT